MSRESLLEYENETYKAQGALPADEVDQLVDESEKRFLLTAGQQIAKTINPKSTKTDALPVEKKKARSPGKSARNSLFANIKAEP